MEHSTEVAKLKEQKSQKFIQAKILPDYLGFIRIYTSPLGILQISLCLSVFIPMGKKKKSNSFQIFLAIKIVSTTP